MAKDKKTFYTGSIPFRDRNEHLYHRPINPVHCQMLSKVDEALKEGVMLVDKADFYYLTGRGEQVSYDFLHEHFERLERDCVSLQNQGAEVKPKLKDIRFYRGLMDILKQASAESPRNDSEDDFWDCVDADLN